MSLFARCRYHFMTSVPSTERPQDAAISLANTAPYRCPISSDCVANSGAKKYHVIVCKSTIERHQCSESGMYEWMTERDEHRYEIIQTTRPARLYFDLDRSDGDPIDITAFFDALHTYVQGDKRFDRRVVLQSHRPGKSSYHIVFPDAVFSGGGVGTMKLFVVDFHTWYSEHYPQSAKYGEEEHVLDKRVYSSRRNFRAFNQSKQGKCTPLIVDTLHSSPTDIQPYMGWIQSPWLEERDVTITEADFHATWERYLDKDIYRDKHCVHKAVTMRVKESWEVQYRTIRLTEGPEEIGRVLLIRKDADLLPAIDARMLRDIDFMDGFIRAFGSLRTSLSIDKEQLRTWAKCKTAQKFEHYYSTIEPARERLRCGMAIHCAERYGGFHVIDLRQPVLRADPEADDEVRQFKYPTKSNGFKLLEGGTPVTDCLLGLSAKDGKHIGKRTERARTVFIGGRMGQQKTKCAIDYAIQLVKRGGARSIGYIGPRRLLVENITNRVREHMPHVFAFYSGTDDRRTFREQNHDMYPIDEAFFAAACINSAYCLPPNMDLLIIDELVMCTGNLYIDVTERRSASGVKYTTEITTMTAFVNRVQDARIVLMLEAALHPRLMDAFAHLRTWSTPNATVPPLYANEFTQNSWLKWINNVASDLSRGERKRVRIMRSKARIEIEPLHITIVPPTPRIYGPIYERIIFFETMAELEVELMDDVLNKGLRCVAYASTSKQAHRLGRMLNGHTEFAPDVTLVNADWPSDPCKRLSMIDDGVLHSLCTVVTIVLGAGFSIEVPNAADVAYLFLELRPGTAYLADMIQLCARFRSVVNKTLKVGVSFLTSYAVHESAKIIEQPAVGKVKALIGKEHRMRNSLAGRAFMHTHEWYMAYREGGRSMMIDQRYAIKRVQAELATAFSIYDASTDDYAFPECILGCRCKKPQYDTKAALQSQKKLIHYVVDAFQLHSHELIRACGCVNKKTAAHLSIASGFTAEEARDIERGYSAEMAKMANCRDIDSIVGQKILTTKTKTASSAGAARFTPWLVLEPSLKNYSKRGRFKPPASTTCATCHVGPLRWASTTTVTHHRAQLNKPYTRRYRVEEDDEARQPWALKPSKRVFHVKRKAEEVDNKVSKKRHIVTIGKMKYIF